MTVNIPNTELNQRLSTLVRNSIAASQFNTAAKATFWRFVGIGILMFGIGIASGLCFYGYSYIIGNSDSLGLLSSALSRALSEVTLQASAEGTVKLEPREIALAKGQTISFDNHSKLLLDPDSKIRADGEIAIQTPSISAPQSPSAQALPKVPTISNFTVFKRVPFDKGVIMTGWVFLTSVQKTPSSQYCYYSESADSSGLFNVILAIAEDQKMETPQTPSKDFDMGAAFNRCIWFRSESQ
jgi:hypothetical protein